MRNVTGAPAAGQDFFDRIGEMTQFWRDLETDNLLILAPRRVGKTSLMKRMQTDGGQHRYCTVYVDVSDCSDELHFVQRLYSAILETQFGDRLWSQIQDSWLGKQLSRIQKLGGGGFSVEFGKSETSWTRLGEELAGALSGLAGSWLIQIDELPVFVLKLLGKDAEPERARVREFLYWMRRIRLQYTGLRWMLAGSIGLDTVARRLNIADAINDLSIQTLGAFSEETALAFLDALAKEYSVQLGPAVQRYIVTRSGWPIPFYLQLIFHTLRDVTGEVLESHVDQAIEDLLSPAHRGRFDYWRQRLYDELGRTQAEQAFLLLNYCCRTPEGVSRAALGMALIKAIPGIDMREDTLRYLLDVLQNDGYLVESKANWLFRSPLLREFWLRRVAPPESYNG